MERNSRLIQNPIKTKFRLLFPVIKSKQQTWRPVDSAAVSWLSKTSGAAETLGTSTREGFCKRACNLVELHGKERTESFGLVEMVAEELHIGKRVVERDEEIAMASILLLSAVELRIGSSKLCKVSSRFIQEKKKEEKLQMYPNVSVIYKIDPSYPTNILY